LARDLGGWLLERETGARPSPGGAERHDLLRFIRSPRCAGAFPAGELLRTVRRWAEMLRLDLRAGGTIELEQDDRPLQPSGARAVASLEAHRTGLGARAEQANRELHARAALTDLPAGLALRELDPWLAAWGELRGRALAAALRLVLRERFDEDWWRNPRSLAAL